MDELRLIERLGAPAEPDEEVIDHARRLLRAEMATVGRPSPRPKVGRLLAAAAVLVTIAVVATLVVPALTGEEPAASATLRRMSQVALTQPFRPVHPGQYLYVKTRASWLSCHTTPADGFMCEPNPTTREKWVAPDGSGRIKQGWDQEFGPGEMTFVDLSAVPTEVDALRRYVEERAGGEVSAPTMPTSSVSPAPNGGGSLGYRMFLVVGDMLRETNAPPELRAALYEVVSTLEGVELIGETTDQIGRPGIGVGFWDGASVEILIFDPTTSAILGERRETSDGRTVEWSAIVASGVVGSTEARPDDRAE
jgi:hypothetical protein